MKNRLFGLLTLITACVCLTFSGCASKLASGGAYAPTREVISNGQTNIVATAAPDKGFFVADAAFDLAYSAVDAAFNFEKNNRLLLWQISPEIKHTLDKLRPQAFNAVQQYALARDAYMANPTPAGLDGLKTALGKMQQLSSAAQAVLPK